MSLRLSVHHGESSSTHWLIILGWTLSSSVLLDQVEQLDVDGQTAQDKHIWYCDTTVHQVEHTVLAELGILGVELRLWEEVDWAFFILHFDVFVVTD
jgi:hypothetical protein